MQPRHPRRHPLAPARKPCLPPQQAGLPLASESESACSASVHWARSGARNDGCLSEPNGQCPALPGSSLPPHAPPRPRLLHCHPERTKPACTRRRLTARRVLLAPIGRFAAHWARTNGCTGERCTEPSGLGQTVALASAAPSPAGSPRRNTRRAAQRDKLRLCESRATTTAPLDPHESVVYDTCTIGATSPVALAPAIRCVST